MAMKFMAFPGQIFWRGKARQVLEKLMVVRMFDRHLMLIGDVIVTDDEKEIPWELIEAKQISIFESETPIHAVTDYISDSLWTCNCKQSFIRSKLFPVCLNCGTTLNDQTRRLKPIGDVINWGDFTVDAATYKLDPNDSDY